MMSINHYPFDLVWIPEQSYQLQRGEVLVIPFVSTEYGPTYFSSHPQDDYVDIHTNCKKVSVFLHRTFWSPEASVMPLEAVSPFHPDLIGKDLLTLFNDYDGSEGRLFSLSCDAEDTPLCSHTRIIVPNELGGMTNVLTDNSICHCAHWIYQYSAMHRMFNGIPRYLYNNNALMPCETQGSCSVHPRIGDACRSAISQLPYADKKVKRVLYPTSPFDTAFSFNTLYITISTSPEGRFTTYVNGSLLPDSLFVVDDPELCRYYIAGLTYSENIPPIVEIENVNGLSARFDEVHPYYRSYNLVEYAMFYYVNSGCTYEQYPVRPNIGVGVFSYCANDTLRVYTEGNCEQYPITWTIEDSTFTLLTNDTLCYPLLTVDTLHLTMVVEKNCPDTIVDTVYVVLRPHLSLPSDTVICRGAPITAHCDMFGFYSWSNGATRFHHHSDRGGHILRPH